MKEPASRAGSASLEIDAVTVRFAGVLALDAVSVDVHPGEIHALIGPNGAGKSTLFNVVSRLYASSSGTVRLDGRDIGRTRAHRLARLGVARTFQNLASSKTETVEETLLVGRQRFFRSGVIGASVRAPRWRLEERAARKVVQEVADFIGLRHKLGHAVGSLSYGEQKKLELGRAICMKPRLLLLDEPAAGLDPAETRDMGTLIETIRASLETTVMLVEHDMSLVMGIADRISVLNFGRLIARGTPAEVAANPEVVEAYLGVAHEQRREDDRVPGPEEAPTQ